jgi:hypothetical protein
MKYLAIILSTLGICLLSPPAYASSANIEPTVCKATKWPYSRSQPKGELFKQIEALDRPTLIEYYFGELTTTGSKESVASELALYLSQTEMNADLRTFYKFLEASAGLKESKIPTRKLDLTELCEVYAKTLAIGKTSPQYN